MTDCHKHEGYWSVSCQHRASLPVRMTREVRGQGKGSAACFALAPSFVCSSALHFYWIFPFSVILFPLGAWCSLCRFSTPCSLRSLFYFPPLVAPLMLTCSHPPRQTHTRIDLTISAIQPPKSNYHGHNTVIKSNGLLDEAPTRRQNKSFSSLLHIIPSVPLPGTMNWVHTSPRALYNSTFSFIGP